MKKKKFNQQLLNEEIKRFKAINEYTFITSEDDVLDDKKDDLILGINEEDPEEDVDAAAADAEAELGLGGDEEPTDAEGGEPADDEGLDFGDEELGGDEELDLKPAGEPDAEAEGGFGDEGGEEEVELDVTELVAGTEEAKQAADDANAKIGELMGMVDNLEGKLSSMGDITSKIDALSNDLEKRMPTPVEKLEMRSKDSYPYNLKLTDYWAEKEGNYDAMGGTEDEIEGEPKEYTLTQQDVDADYSDAQIKDSFDENPYEEEYIVNENFSDAEMQKHMNPNQIPPQEDIQFMRKVINYIPNDFDKWVRDAGGNKNAMYAVLDKHIKSGGIPRIKTKEEYEKFKGLLNNYDDYFIKMLNSSAHSKELRF
jgi:hypothetical protein